MKKKMVSLFLTTCLLVSSLALMVSASDYNAMYCDGINAEDMQFSNSNDTDTSNTKGEIILTRHSDGTVTKKFYDDSELSTTDCDGKQQSLPEYFPDCQIITAVVTYDKYSRDITE